MTSAVVVVGGGPTATGLVERLLANAPELLSGRRLVVHVVDPFPPGAGRVWRTDQSPLLLMNSRADEVTMFTDETVACEGPIRPGPSLHEWARSVTAGDAAPDLVAEAHGLGAMSFPSRRLQGAYLAWVFDRVVAGVPAEVTVRWHRARVTGVDGDPQQVQQQVHLSDGTGPLRADVVVVATGHADVEPTGESGRLARFAADHGLVHLPAGYAADTDLSVLAPGMAVIVAGLGLAFVDLVVLLTEGRGGRFEPAGPGGRLAYRPSGDEPRLLVGSRRGTPYHPKASYRRDPGAPPLELPRFLGRPDADALLARPGPLDFRRDVWPRLADELGWAYYQELFRLRPDRVRGSWAAFAAGYPAPAVVAAAVPDPADRLDLVRLDRPLGRERFASLDALQPRVRELVAASRARRSDPRRGADLAVVEALISTYPALSRIVGSGRLDPVSRARNHDGWWTGLFNSLLSGPPASRLDELVALSEAGVVRFLGADLCVEPDPVAGGFVAHTSTTDEAVTAPALVEARLPTVADGARLRVDPDLHVLDTAGRPHPRRFAMGIPTDRPATTTFARPRTNSPAFRQSDHLARTILTALR